MTTDAIRETQNSYKREMVVGVATSLISSLIIWFCRWIFSSVSTVGADLPTTIESIIYTKAASVAEFTPFIMVLDLIQIVLLAAMLSVVYMSATIKWRIKREVTRDLKEKQDYEELARCRVNVQTENQARQYTRKLRRKLRALEKESKRVRVQLWVLLVITLLIVATILSAVVTFVRKPIELKNQFDLELQIIAPYVEEGVITELRSKWILMNSKKQYLEIYEIIDAILVEQNIGRYNWSLIKTITSGAGAPSSVY